MGYSVVEESTKCFVTFIVGLDKLCYVAGRSSLLIIERIKKAEFN